MGKRVIILITAILIIDQIVKVIVKTQMYPHEQIGVIDGFFQLYYIENKGMAFGTTLGNGVVGKYALSIFRLFAIIGIGYYIKKLLQEKATPKGMIFAVGMIFAGAAGNLIDGALYDYIWELDPTIAWNYAEDANGSWMIGEDGTPVLRHSGFLLGSVVDMFQFTARWPSWMPFGLGGEEIFAAIWNVADAAISIGVAMIILNYRKFFKKDDSKDPESSTQEEALPSESPADQ